MTREQQLAEMDEFQWHMTKELEENMGKGGWHACNPIALLRRVYEEIAEVEDELSKRGSPDFDLERVYSECADVANLIGMVASRVKMRILGDHNVSAYESGKFDKSARIWSVGEAAAAARPPQGGPQGDALPAGQG